MQETTISKSNFEECMKCTICTAYCPVVPVNPLYPGPKQAGPDGERLRLKNGFFFDENLKYCMNCKRCEVSCPSGVHIADLIHSARLRYSKHKPNLRDRILAETDFMGKVARPLAPVVNTMVSMKPVKAVMDSVMGISKNCDFPKYTFHGFIGWFNKNAKAKQAEFKNQLAYFHGCSTEYQHPEVGIAFVKVANALGYGVNLMDERCCGVAKVSNLLKDRAVKIAKRNVGVLGEQVELGRPIVATATTCTFTIRDEYPGILGVDNSKIRESVTLAEKFFYELIDSGKAELIFRKDFKARVAYHTPCHMEKLGWQIFTKRLMGLIPGLEFIPLDSNCCGIAGTYGFKKENRRASEAIGKPLFDNIKRVDPDYVTTECDTCKWQIEMCTGYKVVNPIIILADALDLEATARLNSK